MKRGLIGRVHVELEDYTADVFLTGTSTPMVHEVDRASGREAMEEAALHRLVLRAREPGGTITVYEGEDEASADALTIVSEPRAPVAEPPAPAEPPPPAAGSAARPIALPPGYASASMKTATSEPVRPDPMTSATNLRSQPGRPVLESAGSKMIDSLTNAPQKGSEW